ncbi:MAG: GtrA family protein [Muribaculaceae bacterium]|nr:GtrA family protein [Muribaculaceae bacterium]
MDSPEKSPSGKPKTQLTKIKEKVLHSDGFFFTLLRSSVSSQLCGWIDTLTSFLVFSLIGLSAWMSTALGAFVGGVFNCIINYRFTFHAFGVDWRVALTKFVFVWTGSLLLNSFGTEAVYSLVKDWQWLYEIKGIGKDGIFLAARLFVALTVSLCWNFLLQRHFVFKVTRLDPYIGKFLTKIGIGSKNKIKNDANR